MSSYSSEETSSATSRNRDGGSSSRPTFETLFSDAGLDENDGESEPSNASISASSNDDRTPSHNSLEDGSGSDSHSHSEDYSSQAQSSRSGIEGSSRHSESQQRSAGSKHSSKDNSYGSRGSGNRGDSSERTSNKGEPDSGANASSRGGRDEIDHGSQRSDGTNSHGGNVDVSEGHSSTHSFGINSNDESPTQESHSVEQSKGIDIFPSATVSDEPNKNQVSNRDLHHDTHGASNDLRAPDPKLAVGTGNLPSSQQETHMASPAAPRPISPDSAHSVQHKPAAGQTPQSKRGDPIGSRHSSSEKQSAKRPTQVETMAPAAENHDHQSQDSKRQRVLKRLEAHRQRHHQSPKRLLNSPDNAKPDMHQPTSNLVAGNQQHKLGTEQEDSKSDYDPRKDDADEWMALMRRSNAGKPYSGFNKRPGTPAKEVFSPPAVITIEPGDSESLGSNTFGNMSGRPFSIQHDPLTARKAAVVERMHMTPACVPVMEVEVKPSGDDESSLGSMGFLFNVAKQSRNKPNTADQGAFQSWVPSNGASKATAQLFSHRLKPTVAGTDYNYYKSWIRPPSSPKREDDQSNDKYPVASKEDPPANTNEFKPRHNVVTILPPTVGPTSKGVSADLETTETTAPESSAPETWVPSRPPIEIDNHEPSDEWERWKIARSSSTAQEASSHLEGSAKSESSSDSNWAPSMVRTVQPPRGKPRRLEESHSSSSGSNWVPPAPAARMDFAGRVSTRPAASSRSRKMIQVSGNKTKSKQVRKSALTRRGRAGRQPSNSSNRKEQQRQQSNNFPSPVAKMQNDFLKGEHRRDPVVDPGRASTSDSCKISPNLRSKTHHSISPSRSSERQQQEAEQSTSPTQSPRSQQPTGEQSTSPSRSSRMQQEKPDGPSLPSSRLQQQNANEPASPSQSSRLQQQNPKQSTLLSSRLQQQQQNVEEPISPSRNSRLRQQGNSERIAPNGAGTVNTPSSSQRPLDIEEGPTPRVTVHSKAANRRFPKSTVCCCICLAVVSVGGAIAAAVLVFTGRVPNLLSSNDPPSPATSIPAPTSAPVQQPLDEIESLIVSESPETSFPLANPSSPQSQALFWLSKNQFLSTYADFRLLQRFVLATLYHSTNGDSWNGRDLWLSDINECDWRFSADVSQPCNQDERLESIVLTKNGMNGVLPWNELGILATNLQVLSVRENELSGMIPSTVGALSNVEELDLSQNQFSGTLPRALTSVSALKTLRLNDNNLSGPIPSELGRLRSLRNLYLSGNDLTGTMPQEVCELGLDNLEVNCGVDCSCCTACGDGSSGSPGTGGEANLSGDPLYELIVARHPMSREALIDLSSPQRRAFQWLKSSANANIDSTLKLLQRYALVSLFYATEGEQWGSSESWLSERDECLWYTTAESGTSCDSNGNLVEINLQNNNLQGSIPGELIFLWNTLEALSLQENRIEGSIPGSLASLGKLQNMNLSGNNIFGVIPTEIGNMGNLLRLALSNNNLFSNIPTELGMLSQLELLDLGSNQLTGRIPPTLGNMQNLAGLSLYNNFLSGTIPSALSNLTNLQLLYVDDNEFTSPIPNAICQMGLNEFWGDCEEIQCTCCTTCCTSTGCE